MPTSSYRLTARYGSESMPPEAALNPLIEHLLDHRSVRTYLQDPVTDAELAAMGVPREGGFDITAASEVMAILCLANDYRDLKARLGRMIVGFGRVAERPWAEQVLF